VSDLMAQTVTEQLLVCEDEVCESLKKIDSVSEQKNGSSSERRLKL